jgi:hypothetical protein
MKTILSKSLVVSLCLIGFANQVYAQEFLDNSHWTLVANEEFNTSIADLQTRWKLTSGIPTDLKPNWYTPVADPNNVRLANGYIYFETQKLVSPITVNGNTYLYSVGDIQSLANDVPACDLYSTSGYLYGMYEIRCKLPKKAGQYTAFWMHGKGWPPEIDVFEHNARFHDYFFSTAHYGTNADPQEWGDSYYYPFDLTDDFHTWTLVWTPAKLIWFFDGQELKTDAIPVHVPGATASNMVERCKYMKMIIQTGAGLNHPDRAETTFDPFIVDYIRVYKPSGNPLYTGDVSPDFDTWHDNQKTLYANTPYKTSG